MNMNPEERKKFRNMLQEAVNSHYREEAEKELRRNIAERAKEELNLEKKQFNRLARVVYRDEIKKVEEEAEGISELYEVFTQRENGAV